MNDTITVASGAVPIYGGRLPITAPPSALTAMMGDSLTTHLLGYNWSPFFWINGLAGGKLQLVGNAGVSGQTVSQMLARVDNDYTNASPGLAGLGTLGHVFFRGGTNDARASTTAASLSATYTALLDKLGTHAEKVYILSVPPMGPSEGGYAAKNALTIEYNSLLSAYAATHAAKFVFVNDSVNLRSGDGSQLAGYFQADGIHNAGAATYQEGVDGYAALSSTLYGYSYSSPLSTSNSDVYPAQPQWFTNPAMIGTTGSAGTGFTGPVVTGLSVGRNGGGITGTCSVVAADVGDTNQSSWQRITPTQVTRTGAGESIRITSALAGRAITTVDPAALDVMLEVRLNGFDSTYFSSFKIWVQGNGGTAVTADLDLKMGGGAITKTVVLRHKMPRPNANAHTSATLFFDIPIAVNNTGSMGSFDFRCITIRG